MSPDNVSVLDERYQLADLIGRGGMAEVYRGTDLVLGRAVAVKVLRESAAAGSEKARFRDEARTLATLTHPGLTTLLDAGFSADRPYLVLELVDGTNLATCCAGDALEPERVASIGLQVADALAYAHRQAVVHRDVKPANVLLAGDGRALLTDFGIARLLSVDAHHTRTGTTVGSAPYLAPEQVRGDQISPAVDIYALGLTLLEALTGRRCYPGPPMEAALARLHRSPEVPCSLPAPWPAMLSAMTVLAPEDRPTAAQVAEGLRALTGPAAAVAPPVSATRVLSVPGPSSGPSSAPSSGPSHDARLDDTQALHLAPGPGNGATSPIEGLRDRAGSLRAARRRTPRDGSTASGRRRLGLAVLTGLVAAAAVVLTVLLGSDATGGAPTPSIPRGVPSNLQSPLSDLHEAVDGGGR